MKGLRLPTAIEREYAAEALLVTEGGLYLDILRKAHELPMYGSGSWGIHDRGLMEQDKLEMNAFSLHGMLGNAHEWCSDNNSYKPRSPGAHCRPAWNPAEWSAMVEIIGDGS